MANTQEYFSSVFYQFATDIHIKCKELKCILGFGPP